MNWDSEEWWERAPHHWKYTEDHPVYLTAQEAWSAREAELVELRAECEQLKRMNEELKNATEMLRTEAAICRDAIEVCLEVADNLPSDDDGDAAVRRTTLRRLNEAVGKAVPRLMMERSEGQKLYGLNYREMCDECERLRKVAEVSHSALRRMIDAKYNMLRAVEAVDEALNSANDTTNEVNGLSISK